MNKKIVFTIILSLIIAILSACSSGTTDNNREHTSQELQRLCRIEIYSAEDDTLINTIEDSDMLSQFNGLNNVASDFTDNEEEIKNALKDSTPLYRIVAYKSPVAVYNDGELEKLYTITVYKDTNIIKTEVSEETIKSFPVPSEYLTFYEDVTDEEMEFLMSLTSFSIDDESGD
ncbi:hypothetical protein KQI42_18050 [Tissierella sp. MSJ-40]|uniref:Lipoprotein n=1 Tax=Tissierella simiarum TaxID=2841534 RepID=A0ABS6EAF8_9FIRM|nr:hypothetical protein [Tissierella simiarum]MBU5439918.1 hypothetical protein [Tissierella simiarum]